MLSEFGEGLRSEAGTRSRGKAKGRKREGGVCVWHSVRVRVRVRV